MLRPLLALSVIALAASFLAAQPASPTETKKTFVIDPVHSATLFRISHLGASYFHGRFNDFSGSFTLADSGTNPFSADVVVKSESVDTNSTKRDGHLRSEDFFNAKEHSTISFKTTSSRKLTGEKYQVAGDLTMLGVTRPITADVEVYGPVTSARMGMLAGFETVFTIKRSDFGMKFMAGPGELGDDVRVTVSVEGQPKK